MYHDHRNRSGPGRSALYWSLGVEVDNSECVGEEGDIRHELAIHNAAYATGVAAASGRARVSSAAEASPLIAFWGAVLDNVPSWRDC